MDKALLKYMSYGKMVKAKNGATYRIICNVKGNDTNVKVVSKDKYAFYHHTKEQIRRGIISKEEGEKVIETYLNELPVEDIEPADEVRFINSKYETLFKVPDLGYILENGKKKRVVYLDDYHFTFTEGTCYGCFHICQYAEICERNGITVVPA